MKGLAIIAVALLALTACGHDNTDPRYGKVTLDESGCFWGDCHELYKVCVGPDLHVIYDEAGDDDYSRTVTDSPECEGGPQ